MYGSLDVSTSGLIAQRTRLAVSALNIANQQTILNADGEYEPFRRRIPMLASGDPASGSPQGVHVAAITLDDAPLMPKYEPGSPFADEEGYVRYPNISPVVEQLNAMEAMRAYEANIAAVEATKSMMSVALEMLA
jgi:flagellar basal-body rod protein FlgC